MHKEITVDAPIETAFAVFTGQPARWLPPEHAFLRGAALHLEIEAHVGGRFYERAADGAKVVRGTILAWEPPERLTMTWRIGPGWQPIDDDERASRITVAFTPAGAGTSRVSLTYRELWRHGAMGEQLYSVLSAPGPGETLTRYAEVVAQRDSA